MTFLFSGGKGDGYVRHLAVSGSPRTLAYWSRGCSVPDMCIAPGTYLRKSDTSAMSMHAARRYSPSESTRTDLT